MYNVNQYIDRCIESLVNQDTDDYEIIVINDASTDDSLLKAKNWESKNSRVRIIDKDKNSGLSDTRNVGLKSASGDYILFIDSDDYIDYNSLGKLEKELKSCTPDILYFGYWVVTEKKLAKVYNFKSKHNVCYQGHEFIKNELLNRNLPIPACIACYKRTLITDNNLYFATGILHEDVRWSPEILYRANKVYTSSLCFYRYIIREDSISQHKDRTQNGVDLLATCYYLMNFSKTINDTELRKDFINYIAMTYMKAVAVNNLERHKEVHRHFPIKNVNNYKDRIKAIVFMASPFVYKKIYMYIKVQLKGNTL